MWAEIPYTRGGTCDVATIYGHRRHGLADGEQSVILCPIWTEPESTARCVPRAPLRVVSTIEEA